MASLFTPYVVIAIVSVLLLGIAGRWPRAARLPFALLFFGASLFNAWIALRTPTVYVEAFAPVALPPMREFILRVVALAPGPFVLTVAAGQLAAGVALAVGKGTPYRVAVIGTACFLVGISWLGLGAAFPLNLVLAAAVLLLLRASRAGPESSSGAAAPAGSSAPPARCRARHGSEGPRGAH